MSTDPGESAGGSETSALNRAAEPPAPSHPQGRQLLLLAMGALGVVYGDIGTSPLYAVRECFFGDHAAAITRSNILGVLSLIFWAITLIVSIKYICLVLRADNRGEGGVLALLALAVPESKQHGSPGRKAFVIGVGVFGAALLYGDGMITPAISVMSAVEGLEVATPAFKPFVIPITIVILFGLFAVQRTGTGRVGKVFGPLTLIWFFTLTVLGIGGIVREPGVFAALNPLYGLDFILHAGNVGFYVLGAVVLAVTGGEALYADMGHFGRRPMRLAWFAVVCPALLLNYFGQGALLLSNPAAAENPFYRLAPSWALYPLVAIATSAAIIASQALISGAYSLTMQAIQLGFSPRMKIDHTSSETRGQIYMPQLNWLLMIACIGLVIGFRSSSRLASAYGVAVTFTMLITTVLFYFAAQRLWGWKAWQAGLVCVLFFLVEATLCAANLLKLAHGGWFPLVVAAIAFTIMATWKTGRRVLGERLRGSFIPITAFLDDLEQNPPLRVPGTAVFLSSNAEATPLALLHNIKHNRVLHERVVFLTLVTEDIPHVQNKQRLTVEELRPHIFRVVAHYGFMEEPHVPNVLKQAKDFGLNVNPMNTTYFLSRETILPTKRMPGMALWRESLFAFLSRNAQRPTDFFRIPPNRVVELGMQVEM